MVDVPGICVDSCSGVGGWRNLAEEWMSFWFGHILLVKKCCKSASTIVSHGISGIVFFSIMLWVFVDKES